MSAELHQLVYGHVTVVYVYYFAFCLHMTRILYFGGRNGGYCGGLLYLAQRMFMIRGQTDKDTVVKMAEGVKSSISCLRDSQMNLLKNFYVKSSNGLLLSPHLSGL
ncbi:MAG: hypothetical protein PHZ03_06010 [Syntrophomonas sp.]|nr:hypothetical protein [Syntrophomonas sp.]